MKILFYDGDLRYLAIPGVLPASFSNYSVINALWGYTDNVKALDLYREKCGEDTPVITNSLVALDHKYGWNKKENHTDIYFYVESKHDFVRCDELSGREIRESHSIMKMFMNGAFDLEDRDEKTS